MNYPAPQSALSRQEETLYICTSCGTESGYAGDYSECEAKGCKHAEHKALCCDCSVTCDLCAGTFCREHVVVIDRGDGPDDFICKGCTALIIAAAA